MNLRSFSSTVFSLSLLFSLAACEDSTAAAPPEGVGGAEDSMGGAMPEDSEDQDSASTGGRADEGVGGAGLGVGGMGGQDGSLGNVDEQLGDIILPEVTFLGGKLSHQLEMELDGDTISEGLTWELVEGNLPDGVTLSANGWLTGRPSQAGTFLFRLRATSADVVAVGDVEWKIEGARWLAYVGSAEGETNLFLLNTALVEPTPVPVFSDEHGVKAVLAADFSPFNRSYLSALVQTQSGTQAYLIEMFGAGVPTPKPVKESNSSALFFWEGSPLKYGYVLEEGSTSHVYVNDEKAGSFENLTGVAFLDEKHLIVSTYSNGTATVESFDLESQSGTGAMWGGVGPIQLMGSVGGPGSSHAFQFGSPTGIEFYWMNSLGGTSYLTSAMDHGAVTFNDDFTWAARSFPAGAELKNYLQTGLLSLSEYPEYPTFSSGSRWFAGIRDVHFVRELVLVDLKQQTLGEMIVPGTWAEFYGFSSHWQALWAAGMTGDGKLRFLDFGWNGDQAPTPPSGSSPGAIVQVDSFDCTPDGALLTVMGATEAGHGARRTVQVYDAKNLLAVPRDLLADMPKASLLGRPTFSLDANVLAFEVKEESGDDALLYTRATYDAGKSKRVACGEGIPCEKIGWFQFRQ